VRNLFKARPAQVLAGLTLVLSLGVIAFETRRSLVAEHRLRVEAVFANSERNAQQLAMRTAEVFDRVNQSTLLIQHMWAKGTLGSLADLSKAGVVASELLNSLYLADRAGYVYDTTSTTTAQYVADEDFFKLHVKVADLDVLISPVWVDPITQRPGVPMSRRLDDGGAFRGIVTATIDPAALSMPLARLIDRGTVVGVLGADGVYRSRTVDGVLSFGDQLDPVLMGRRMAEARQTGRPVLSRIDGIERYGWVVPVERYPMYAVVAVSAHAALEGYRNERDKVLRWAVLAALGTLAAGALFLRFAHSLDQTRIRVRKAESAFRATLDGSLDAVSILEPVRDAAGVLQDFRVADCNRKAAAMRGLAPDQMLGRMLCQLVPELRPAGLLARFEEVLVSRAPYDAELLSHSPRLPDRWFHHQVVPLEDGIALITRDITSRKDAEKALATLARVDELTSLLNRRGFEEKLGEAMARARRDQQTLALLYLDLDGFKGINDSFGHAAGDAVLEGVARRLVAAVRETDAACRLGGDEFAVILEAAGTLQDVNDLCARVLASLREPHRWEDHELISTPSIGVALLQPGETADSLRERADAAMYEAKAAGKARVVWGGEVRLTHPAK
jgi:diguanylate cyclase (GGDEF)-like protein/PAS domain S-box-containing protein